MKKYITIIALAIIAFTSNAQIKLNDFGRIILNAYLPDDVALPTEAKNVLLTKLNQLTSNNGMGGSAINPRFIITANINVGTKDILAGPPQMIAQNIEAVGDFLSLNYPSYFFVHPIKTSDSKSMFYFDHKY